MTLKKFDIIYGTLSELVEWFHPMPPGYVEAIDMELTKTISPTVFEILTFEKIAKATWEQGRKLTYLDVYRWVKWFRESNNGMKKKHEQEKENDSISKEKVRELIKDMKAQINQAKHEKKPSKLFESR